MHTLTRFFALLLLVVGLSPLAQASHIQGGTLTYTALGGNQYRVVLKYYRDCSGISAPTAATLNCSNNAACGAPVVVSAVMTPQVAPLFGSQYCATITGTCSPGGPSNYELVSYAATVTLPPAAIWVLSVTDCCRPTSANLLGQTGFRTETILRNQVVVSGATRTIVNTSAVSANLAASFIPWKQTSTVSNSTFDADGDSLVYSLVAPLENCGLPSPYAPRLINQANGNIILNTNPLCILSAAWGTPTYTATLPLDVRVDTLNTCPIRTSVPRFQFDPASGGIALEPALFDAMSQPSSGTNQYAVAIKIQELRRLGGQWVEVGLTRRELLLTVYDCGTNLPPRITPTVTLRQGTTTRTQPLSRVIPVIAGEPVVVDLVATDRNSGQAIDLNLRYNAMPGAVLQSTGPGTARLTFTPPANTPNGTYRVAVTAEDNNCPIKGLETQSITFRVVTVLATRTRQQAVRVAAWPTPFAEAVRFQLPGAGAKNLTVTDAMGRAVAVLRTDATGAGRWQPAAGLAPGLYTARTADGQAVVRLLYQPE